MLLYAHATHGHVELYIWTSSVSFTWVLNYTQLQRGLLLELQLQLFQDWLLSMNFASTNHLYLQTHSLVF